MLVNRLSGLVLPATSKYLIDDVIGKRRAELLMPLALAAGAATLVQAVTLVRAVAGARRRRAARDHRHAPPRRGARRAAAGPLLRLDAVRRADLAHHDRRRGHPESGRHRPGPAHRQHRHRDRRARVSVLPELVPDAASPSSRSRAFGGAMAMRVQAAAAAVPRARQDQRRGHRPAQRDARRHPHRQDLHRGEARGAGLHARRAPPVPQRRAVDHRRVGDHRVLDGRHRRHRRDDDHRRRPRDPGRHDDARRLLQLHPVHRPDGRAGRADRLDRHADQRGVRRARSHPRAAADADRRRRRTPARRRSAPSPARSCSTT